jgi:hypothetical protein
MSSVICKQFPVWEAFYCIFSIYIYISTFAIFCPERPRTCPHGRILTRNCQALCTMFGKPVHWNMEPAMLSFPESVSEKYFARKVSLPYATRRSTIARCVCATCTSVPDLVRWWILHGLMLGFYLGMSWRAPGHHHVHLDGDW